MMEQRFKLEKDTEWWFVSDNTIKVNEFGYREDLTGEDKYRGLQQDLTEQETVDLLNELYEENIKLNFKISKVEEIINNRLSNDFRPVWDDGKTELFIEEKVGYKRALKQLKKKLIKENIIVEDLE